MASLKEPEVFLSHLHRTDGSATFSQNGYTIIGSVNGPIEVQRRDAFPEEAVIDVVVRPAAGVGGIRERHVELILQATLRQLILIHDFPRTLIQITLQIMNTPENDASNTKLNQASANISILPALIQTSVLALLSSALPLAATMTCTMIASKGTGISGLSENPSSSQIQEASSIHVFGFTSQGDLLLAESEGTFDFEEWDAIYSRAQIICCGENLDSMTGDEGEAGLSGWTRAIMENKIGTDLSWRD